MRFRPADFAARAENTFRWSGKIGAAQSQYLCGAISWVSLPDATLGMSAIRQG